MGGFNCELSANKFHLYNSAAVGGPTSHNRGNIPTDPGLSPGFRLWPICQLHVQSRGIGVIILVFRFGITCIPSILGY